MPNAPPRAMTDVFLQRDREPIKAARFIVSGELLHELLMLPADSEVRGLTWSHEKQAYEISVTGSALPDFCLGCAPLLTPNYKIQDGVRSFNGW